MGVKTLLFISSTATKAVKSSCYYFRRTANNVYLLLLLYTLQSSNTTSTLSTKALARITPVPIPCPMAAEPQVGVSAVQKCLLHVLRLIM